MYCNSKYECNLTVRDGGAVTLSFAVEPGRARGGYAGFESFIRSAVDGIDAARRTNDFSSNSNNLRLCSAFVTDRFSRANEVTGGGRDGDSGSSFVVEGGCSRFAGAVECSACGASECSSGGSRACDKKLGSAGSCQSAPVGFGPSPSGSADYSARLVRGKHYKKNKKAKERAKRNRVPVDSGLKSHARDRVGFFSGCSDDVKNQLCETRAHMLVAQNKLKTQQALSAAKEAQMVQDTRVNEVDFELKRLTLEEKLANISEKRGVTQGSARTIVSSTISSSAPTLLSGSVSPNSSISMAEERKLRQDVVSQATELKELREELLRLRSGVPKKRGNVSEWTFKSPYDNFTADGIHKSKLPGYVRNGSNGSYIDGGQDFHLSSHDY